MRVASVSHSRLEPPHVVGAQDVGGRLAQRHVDQRLVLGARRVLVFRAARPDRLADDPHPLPAVLAHERREHRADDPARVAARLRHVRRAHPRRLGLGERRAQQAEPGLGHGDEHRFVAAPGPRARTRRIRTGSSPHRCRTTRRARGSRRRSPSSASSWVSGSRPPYRAGRKAASCTERTVPDTSGQSPSGNLGASARKRRRHHGFRRRSARSPARGAAAGVEIVWSGSSRAAGTSQLTSNSMPSGSCAYSAFVEPWSDAPTSAPRSVSTPRIRCSSARVSTSHARW